MALTPAAIATLGEIMQDKTTPAGVRVTAAEKILDRALGSRLKPWTSPHGGSATRSH
jgi:hypothetical protein